MNPETTPTEPVRTPEPSLYARTKITRNDITIFKRYEGETQDYYFRPSVQGERHTIKLLRLADDSFKQARRILDELAAGRFDVLDKTKSRQKRIATVGEILRHYEKHARAVSGIQAGTVTAAVNALYHLIRQGHGLDLANEAIDRLSSAVLTRSLLEDYKAKVLAGAGADKLKERTAKIRANYSMRTVRSLFAKKLGPDFYEGLTLPDLKKFLAVSQYDVEKCGYRMPDETLLDKIRAHSLLLKKTDPDTYKVYLLSMGSGMRKNEIAHARLRWIEDSDDGGHRIRVQTESDFHIKNDDSRTIPVDAFVVTELRELLADRNKDDYILTGCKTARVDEIFRRFSAWLKNLGWTRRQKTHEMRKIFGSIVAGSAGIRAAQVLLGHASVTTTEAIYADPTRNIPRIAIFKPEKAA